MGTDFTATEYYTYGGTVEDPTTIDITEDADFTKATEYTAPVPQPTYYSVEDTPDKEAVAAEWNIVLTSGDLTGEGITGAFTITAIAEHADPVG